MPLGLGEIAVLGVAGGFLVMGPKRFFPMLKNTIAVS